MVGLFQDIAIGDKVKVTYRPMPYLGTGIQEPVVVEGIFVKMRNFKGINYAILKDKAGADGKVVLERNIMEMESVKKVAVVPPTR